MYFYIYFIICFLTKIYCIKSYLKLNFINFLRKIVHMDAEVSELRSMNANLNNELMKSQEVIKHYEM